MRDDPVPYDYAAGSGGDTFTIPVARIPSRSDKPKLLMMNPGGPGISRVADLRSGREYYRKFSDVYTVVSFDPRGVGGSTPALSCLDDQQKAAIFDQPACRVHRPRNSADRTSARTSGGLCAIVRRSAFPCRHRRMWCVTWDAIRAAMGFDRISYPGTRTGRSSVLSTPRRSRRGPTVWCWTR